MATKEAVFKLRVDTGNSVADINAADKAIQGFNKDLQTTKTIQADSTGSDNFAAKLAAKSGNGSVHLALVGVGDLSHVKSQFPEGGCHVFGIVGRVGEWLLWCPDWSPLFVVLRLP